MINCNELIQDVASRATNPVKAEESFNILCKRFRKYLAKCCLNLCKGFFIREYKEFAKDVYQQTLMKVYLNAHRFDVTRYDSDEAVEFGLMKWMKAIARNELLSMVRKEIGTEYFFFEQMDDNKVELLLNETLYDEKEEHSEDEGLSQVILSKLRVIKNVLNELPKREREIIETALYHEPHYTPSDELDRLSEAYKTTRANIRQIESRLMKLVKQRVLDIYNKL